MIAHGVQKLTESIARSFGASESTAREMSVVAAGCTGLVDPFGAFIVVSSEIADERREYREARLRNKSS